MPERTARWLLLLPALLPALIAPTGAAARGIPDAPTDLPADREALGEAFVESWLAFRRELDTLAHLPVHPRLLDGWFEAAPRFLLGDAVSMAAEPRVVAAAARALARGAGEAERALLAERERRATGSPLADELRACRIRAGDARALERARAGLRDARLVVRERAAFVLAAAGREEGLPALREIVRAHGEESPAAVRGLGLFGAPADARLLDRIARDSGTTGAARAARGEIALRGAFPDHHTALVARDGASSRLVTAGGLYDTWLTTLGGILDGGARASTAVAAEIEERRKAAAGEAREVVRRELAVLDDFWRYTDQRLAATGAAPPWPAGMEQALALVRAGRDSRERPESAARRISAVIAACAWSGEALGHRGGSRYPSGTRALSPGGDRALDGSFATAFYLPPDGRLLLELPPGIRLREAGIAAGCPDGAGPRLRRVRVTVLDGGAERTFEAGFDGPARYYRTVPLDGGPARRLEIRALEIDGAGPACIAAIRLNQPRPGRAAAQPMP